MTPRETLRTRLYFQKLDKPGFKTPADMVRYFGAVQAQDYLGSLWAVGQRTIGATEQSVEAALADRSIVRSWPMRGTLHFTAPEDLRWMLDLLDDRVAPKVAPHQREVGLTKKDFVKGRSIVEREMTGGKILERSELYALFKRNRIDPSNMRGLHIIGQLARDKVICFGPRQGKQPAFVLLDEWIPKKKTITKEESLSELASRYFISHGPASVHDFAWWSGLTITDAGRAVEMVKSQLQKVDDLWMSRETVDVVTRKSVKLLPAYDEYLVSYRKLKDLKSIFTPTIIVNGEVAGTWQRNITNKGVSFTIRKQEGAAIRKEMKRYATFIGKKLLSL